MDLMPVCKGTVTGARSMMAGASRSIGSRSSISSGTPPSSTRPVAFTTRPSRALPTGVSAMRPVAWTSAPAVMAGSSPNSITPISSGARSRAIPSTFPGKMSSSSVRTERNPRTRAIPPPVRVMVPVSVNRNSGAGAVMASFTTDATWARVSPSTLSLIGSGGPFPCVRLDDPGNRPGSTRSGGHRP